MFGAPIVGRLIDRIGERRILLTSYSCLIRAPITDCASAPAGECVKYNVGHCSILPGLHGPCDCFGGELLSGCSADYPGTQCNGSTGTFGTDYQTPTSCFGCYPAPASP